MKTLLLSLAPILGLQLLGLVAGLFVFIHSRGRGVVRMIVVPLALAGLLAVPYLFVQLMGYAVSWPLPRDFYLLAYSPVVQGGRKVAIEIWLRERRDTRLLTTPYDKQLEKVLQEAVAGMKGGGQARITRRGKGNPGAHSDSPDGGYELKMESPADIPKEIPLPPMPDLPPPPRHDPDDRFSI